MQGDGLIIVVAETLSQKELSSHEKKYRDLD